MLKINYIIIQLEPDQAGGKLLASGIKLHIKCLERDYLQIWERNYISLRVYKLLHPPFSVYLYQWITGQYDPCTVM